MSMSVAATHMKSVSNAFSVVRGPLIVSFITFFILAFPGQSHELYRIMAENIAFVWDRQGALSFLGSHAGAQALITLIALGIMSITLWYVSRQLTDRLAPPSDDMSPGARLILRWTPRLIGVLPPIGAALGQLYASPIKGFFENWKLFTEHFSSVDGAEEKLKGTDLDLVQAQLQAQTDATGHVLAWGAIICILLSVALLLLAWWRTRKYGGNYVSLAPWLFHWITRTVSISLIAGMVLIIYFVPVMLPQYIGTVAIFCLFITCVAFAIVPLIYYSAHTGFPVLTSLLGLGVLWGMLDLNDNHVVRDFGGMPQNQAEKHAALIGETRGPLVSTQFVDWFEKRGDREAYKSSGANDQDYPVYVIAAQGGGLYAAYHAAMFMARMQDLCPTFAQHVFAVSGVSGGSLGAAVFSGLAKQHAKNGAAQKCREFTSLEAKDDLLSGKKETDQTRGMLASAPHIRLEHLTDNILNADFLSPLIYSSLFPDLVQRLIPRPFSDFDRARTLERSFEVAWDTAIKAAHYQARYADMEPQLRNPLRFNFKTMWTPQSVQPALILNATEAESGFQWVISPFTLDAPSLLNFPLWNQAADPENPDAKIIETAVEPSLSHAVSLSARFPWVTPPGSIRIRYRNKTQKVSLVDGGYFENSGVATALELIDKLKAQNATLSAKFGQKAKIVLLVLTTGELSESVRGEQSSFGESLSPIRALMNTRTNRAYITIDQAERTLIRTRAEAQAKEVRLLNVRKISFGKQNHEIPLGWHLSASSRETIRAQLGDYRRCTKPNVNFEQKNAPMSDGRVVSLNADCVQRGIIHELNRDVTATLQALSTTRKKEIVQASVAQRTADTKRVAKRIRQRIDRRMFLSCVTSRFHSKGLNDRQIATYNAILDEWDEKPATYKDKRWLAYMLGTAQFETANRMEPATEVGLTLADGKTTREIDDLTIQRLERAGGIYRKLRLRGKTYWRRQPKHGNRAYFGRGLISITHAFNYKRMGKLIGLENRLYENPDLAMDPDIAVKTLFVGMVGGVFRRDKRGRHSLERYFKAGENDPKSWIKARNIVNSGNHKAGEIAASSKKYFRCLNPGGKNWVKSKPDAGWCFQKSGSRVGARKFTAHCLPSHGACAKARAKKGRRFASSRCTFVELRNVAWAPKPGSLATGWYETRKRQFPSPFAQVARRKPVSERKVPVKAPAKVKVKPKAKFKSSP